MALAIKRGDYGYGVVEDNHLSAKRSGHVYGQLPAAAAITQLENGQYVKYDYAAGECNFTGEGRFMMVYNEEKLYDERHQMHRDYVMKPDDFYDGKMYPRVIAIEVGDIYTTNCVKDGTYSVGNKLAVGADGILDILSGSATTGQPVLKVVKEYTMPDGTPGLKLQCIA